MSFQHALLWIDHHEARLFGIRPNLVQKKVLRNDRHHAVKDPDALGSRRERDRLYFTAVSEALGETPEILLLGPGNARREFAAHLAQHHPALARHILDNQACDDEGDEALVERARRFFHAADRMLPAP
jgi:stalled ribosome rescue protein Dom34